MLISFDARKLLSDMVIYYKEKEKENGQARNT
jgi:hypothetical protein